MGRDMEEKEVVRVEWCGGEGNEELVANRHSDGTIPKNVEASGGHGSNEGAWAPPRANMGPRDSVQAKAPQRFLKDAGTG